MNTEMKKKNIGEHEQVCHNKIGDYVKDGGNKCKFFCLEKHGESDQRENLFSTLPGSLNDINMENNAKLKLAHVRELNFVCSVTPKQSVLV